MRIPWSKAAKANDGTVTTDKETIAEVTENSNTHELTDTKPNGQVDETQQQERAGSATEVSENEKDTAIERTTSTAESTDEEDETKYKKGLPLVLLTFGLMMTTFVVALDNTIIATAIPRITTVFDSLNDVGWYGSSYLLTTTALQPTFGKVYTYFNIKWTYIIATLIFELGSVICGAATSSNMLIVGRAVAGVGASAIFSGGMNIVGYTVPLRKRALYIGLLGSMFGIASVVGPLMGGALTDRVSWRWCFYINLPVGAVAIAAVFFFFQNPERKESGLTFKQKIGQMDLIGAFVLITAITCVLLALQWGGTVYPWSDSKVWGCLLGFGLLISIFAVIQVMSGDKATLPPRILIKQRTVLACAMFSAFLNMGIYTHIYYLPFYFQAVKGTTAEGSGIRTIPYLVSCTIASIFTGATVTAIGYYVPFTWVGSALFTIGAGLIYTLKVNSGAAQWIGYQILTGAGVGIGVQIPFVAIQVVLNKKDMPTGNAIPIFFVTLGGAISISIAQNIFSNALAKQIPLHTHGIDPRVIINAGATHIRDVTPPDQLAGVLLAYDNALSQGFILAIAVGILGFLASLLFEWKNIKGKKISMAGGA